MFFTPSLRPTSADLIRCQRSLKADSPKKEAGQRHFWKRGWPQQNPHLPLPSLQSGKDELASQARDCHVQLVDQSNQLFSIPGIPGTMGD